MNSLTREVIAMLFPRFSYRIPAALLAAALALPFWGAQTALAQSNGYDQDLEDQPPSRVGRISNLDGDAALRQPGSSQWEDVDRNTPVFEGDEFFTTVNSRLEMQFGGGRYVRLGSDTDVVVAKLDTDSVRLEVPVGSVIVSLRDFNGGDEFEISAPSASITIKDEGVYRVDVTDDGDTSVAVHDGRATVSTPDRSVQVDDGETATMPYGDPSNVDLVAWTGYDSFDTWSTGLDQDYARYDSHNYNSGSVTSAFNRSDIYGLAELALYGSWLANSSYGNCWIPRVGSGWSPYSNGYWQYYPGYGYTFVSYDSWGWAPFHYGRWSYLNGYGWAWIPFSSYGSNYGSYYGGYDYGWGNSYYPWSPGLVSWYQYPNTPGYVWVPLAPGEPYSGIRRLHNRHDRDFVPRHLREGRGIGVSKPGSGARILPGGVKSDFGGRTPTVVIPGAPRDVKPTVARIKPNLSDSIRNRPVVVKDVTVVNGAVKPRTAAGGGVVSTRPIRPAAGGVAVKPTPRKPSTVDEVPTMREERPVKGSGTGVKPRTTKPVTIEPSGGDDSTTVSKPRRRDPVERPATTKPSTRVDRSERVDKPAKPVDRTVEPVERKTKRDPVVRPTQVEPKTERGPRVERTERATPRTETRSTPRSEPRVERAPKPERVERPAPRSEPKVYVAPAPDNGGSKSGNGGGGKRKP